MKTQFPRLLGCLAVAILPWAATAAPPTIACPDNATLECTSSNGAPGVVQTQVKDADGDALMVIWTINGQSVQTNVVASGITTNGVTISLTNQFGFGTNDVTVGVTDDGTNVVMCSTTIIVVDTMPPVIESVTASATTLWPPNHKLRPVNVTVKASDACGPVHWRIMSVESNEPVDGTGDGHTSPDWIIPGLHKTMLRAERSGQGNGRIYTVHVRVFDESENFADGTVKVYVPHDQGHGRPYHDRFDDEDNGPNQGNGKGKGKGNGNGNGNGKGKGKN